MPMLANAEMRVEASSQISASLTSDLHVTRSMGSSGGTSVPVRSAIDSSEALEVEVLVVDSPSRVDLQRRRLQVRQDLREAVSADRRRLAAVTARSGR